MANIGEIEFLVRFDSMNTSFKKVLGEALENVSIGGDTSQKLEEIRTHLKALVVPYSGSRALDEVRAGGHIRQLADPDFLEKRVNQIVGNQTALKHMGFGELEKGSEEAKDAVRIKLSDMHAMMIAQTNVAMKSEVAYKQFYPKLRKMEGYMELITEGSLGYMMKNLLSLMVKEVPMVQRYLELKKKEYGGDFDYAGGEAWWDKLTANIGTGTTSIESQREFYNAMMGHFSEKDFTAIFLGGANAMSPAMKKSFEVFLQKYDIEKQKVLMPRALSNIAQKLYPSKEVFDPKTFIRKDLRVILRDPELTRTILEDLTDLGEDAIDDLVATVKKNKYSLFTGEAAVVGTEGKRERDMARLTPEMAVEELLIAYGGTNYKTIMENISKFTAEEYEAMFEEGTTESIISKVVGLVEELGTSMEFLKAQNGELPNKVSKALEGINMEKRMRE